MKRIIFIALLVATIASICIYFIANTGSTPVSAPCSDPITYRIGDIDSIYDISDTQLKSMLGDIDEAWSAAAGMDLIEYSKKGAITVNLIYGEQQRFFNKGESASSRIELEQTKYESTEKELKKLKKRYGKEKKKYDELVAEYRRFGNAVYADAINQTQRKKNQKKLNEKEASLKQEQQELNRLGNRINAKVSELNSISATIDGMIADYNATYGTGEAFRQGNYKKTADGETINVYSYQNVDELRLLLAHEMGHALGIGHVENSGSVMHYLMKDQKKTALAFTDEDIQALHDKCGH